MSTDSLSVQNTNTIGTSARPQIQMDNADPARQNQQAASDMDIAQESNSDVREAFQVQISLPAQSRLAADADDSTQDTQTFSAEPSEAQSVPGTGQSQGRGGIIDIMT